MSSVLSIIISNYLFVLCIGSPAAGCRGPSWRYDMNDDLLQLLIGQARCFEAGIRWVGMR